MVVDYVDINANKFKIIEQYDVLAMTPGAIMAMENSGFRYFTFDDIYSVEQFRYDCANLLKETEELFSIMDNNYESYLSFPRSYSGNIYWFFGYFVNVHYLSAISRKLKGIYNEFYFLSSREYECDLKNDYKLNSDSIRFCEYINGIAVKIQMLKILLSPKWINLGQLNKYSAVYKYLSILGKAKKVPSYLKKRLTIKRTPIKNHNILVIQDGYEVTELRKYMPDCNFISPINVLINTIFNKDYRISLSDPFLIKELDLFISKWFYEMREQVISLFEIFHQAALCKLSFFANEFEKLLDQYKPAALIYSVGAHTVTDHVCAHISEKRNIPIFYFEHGGAVVFFKDPGVQRHIEENHDIKKINIFMSAVRQEKLKDKCDGKALGSIRLYNLNKVNRTENKDIFYGPSYFNFENYKDLLYNVPDKLLFRVHDDIVSTITELELSMDIKVHSGGQTPYAPNSEEYNFDYFNLLLKRYPNNIIKVKAGYPAEVTIGRYGLIVLDYTGTALLPVAISLNRPVILYLKDLRFINDGIVSDIKKRVYLISKKDELRECLVLYKNNKLDPKLSDGFLNDYVFPTGYGDPGVNIANYIQSRIKSEYYNRC